MSSRTVFWIVVGGLVITLSVICALEPLQNDSWQHYAEAREPFTWQRLFGFAEWSYFHGNPRWGQLVLWGMFYAPVPSAVVTALVIVALLFATMTLIRGRWVRPWEPGDTWLFVQVLATALATTPHYGDIWFSRPNAANYIYPLVVQLAWLVPYRFLAARPIATSWRLSIAIVVIGILAGAGNEHTGIGLVLAAATCMSVAWQRDRGLPRWSFAGIAALVAGYVFVLTAPGQLERYGGAASRHALLDAIAERGVLGNARMFGWFLVFICPMVVTVAIVAGRSLWRCGWLAKPPRLMIAASLLVAITMVTTVLASPRMPPRVLVAPATMVALALGVFMVELATHRGKTRGLRIASVVISSVALASSLAIFVVTGIEGRARLHRIEAAPRGAIVCVEPYTISAPTPFAWGDDFRSAGVMARVARLFGLAKITRGCP